MTTIEAPAHAATAVIIAAEFAPPASIGSGRIPYQRFRDMLAGFETLLAVADKFAIGEPPPEEKIQTEVGLHHHCDLRFAHYGSPFFLQLDVWQHYAPALPVLYLMAKKIAVLPDRIRADREKLRAEAERWRAEQAEETLQLLDVWTEQIKRHSLWADLSALEIRELGTSEDTDDEEKDDEDVIDP